MTKRTAPRTSSEARAELRAARDWLKTATREKRSACAGTAAAVRAAEAPCAAAVRVARAPCAAATRKAGAAKARTRAASLAVYNLRSEKRSKTAKEAAENTGDAWNAAVQAARPEDEGLYSFVVRKYRKRLETRVKQAAQRGKRMRIDEAVAELVESDPEVTAAYHTFLRKKGEGHAPTLKQHLRDLERENASLSRLLQKHEKDNPPRFRPDDDDEIPF